MGRLIAQEHPCHLTAVFRNAAALLTASALKTHHFLSSKYFGLYSSPHARPGLVLFHLLQP